MFSLCYFRVLLCLPDSFVSVNQPHSTTNTCEQPLTIIHNDTKAFSVRYCVVYGTLNFEGKTRLKYLFSYYVRLLP